MIYSEPFPVRLEHQRGNLYVVRNDGFCWGRIVLEDGTNYDVYVEVDLYDYIDEDAAAILARSAKNDGNYRDAESWFLRWEEGVVKRFRVMVERSRGSYQQREVVVKARDANGAEMIAADMAGDPAFWDAVPVHESHWEDGECEVWGATEAE